MSEVTTWQLQIKRYDEWVQLSEHATHDAARLEFNWWRENHPATPIRLATVTVLTSVVVESEGCSTCDVLGPGFKLLAAARRQS